MPSQSYVARFPQGELGFDPNRLYDLVLFVTTVDDPSRNRSRVNWSLTVFRVGSFRSFSFDQRPWSVNIDGQNFSGSWSYDFRNYNSLVLGTGGRIVNHNSDGSKTIGVSASADGGRPLGTASLSGSFRLTTYPRAPNPPPSVSAAVPVGRSIFVSWQAASGGAGVSNYDVDRIENNTSWVRIASGTTALSLTSSSLNPRSTYRFRVRANGPGGSSGFRESNSRTIAPAASPPTTTAARTRRNVTVSMSIPAVLDGSVAITGYTVQRRQDSGAWGDTRTTSASDRTVTYTNLPSSTNQQFRARADTNLGSSDFSESNVIFIPGIPDAPAQVLALQQGAAVQVVVAAPTSDGGAPILTYTIEKRSSDDFATTWSDWGDPVTIPFSESLFLYQNLELLKTYQFRALATNEEGNSENFTESNTVYLPAIVRIREGNQFRLPADYKRYDEEIGAWIGLSTYKRFFNGQWVDLT